MKSHFGRIALLVSASLVVGGGTARAQSDPCDLFPGNPGDLTTKAPGCTASYWQRVGKKHFGGLMEFGATIAIEKVASPAMAAQKMAAIRARPGWTPAAYGEGGVHSFEKSMPDLRTPTDEEVKGNAIEGDLSDLVGDDGTYGAIFSCGANVIYVFSNPSKGPATRQLIGEFETNLRSQNICARPSSGAIAAPVTAKAPSAPASPPTTVDASGQGGGTRYFDGKAAADLMAARASGSRYMAVLSRSYDQSRGCFVEERAWVSTVRASDGGRIGAVVGPSITVCVKGAIMDQASINQTEAKLQNTRNQLAKALQKKAEFEAYLKDPKYSAWARGEIGKIDVYINRYTTYINQTQSSLEVSTPPSIR